jgi:type IV pilus biogenesis protein PilP
MSRATELRSWLPLLCMGLALAFSAQAQTIGDYSRSQRALLESEIAKNTAKALINVESASPFHLTPGTTASQQVALLPPLPGAVNSAIKSTDTEPVPEIAVKGIMILSKRSMVELSVKGDTVLVLAGNKVPGTSWVVANIRQDQVILKSGTKSKLFDLYKGAW